MKIIEHLLLLEYFVLTTCGLRMTHGQIYTKPHTIWGNQNDHGDQQDQLMDIRTKRSLFECGIHGQKPPIDSTFTDEVLPGEWPWLVAVYRARGKEFAYLCGGSLIYNSLVITVAHCIYNYIDNKQMEVKEIAIKVGANQVAQKIYNADGTLLLTAMYMHEGFDSITYINDIAMLVLKEPVTYSKLVKPVCLWEGEDDQDYLEKTIQQGTVVGWHGLHFRNPKDRPHRFKTSIISPTTCRELYMLSDNITSETFCAVQLGSGTHCKNFYGNSLYIEQYGRWMVRGVVSVVLKLRDTCDSITVYTDVAKYRNWISETVYRWSQTNILPVPTSTYATGNNLSWNQQCSKRDEVNKLVTGGQSTGEGEWPWHVAIYHNQHTASSASNLYKCGGSLISVSHVLTAAHCLIDKLINRPISKRSINIYLGTHNIKYFSGGVQFKVVDRMEIHPEYKADTSYKDIAVLRLSSPADLTAAVRPVCLWPDDKVDLSNVVAKNGSVVGWGNDEFGLLAEELMLAELPVVSELTCVRSNIFYYKYTNNFTFCAGLHRDTSVCNGDSGGGIVFKLRSGAGTEEWFLRGIVSLRLATDKPCDPSQYVIFTDVAKYLDWIKNSVSLDI